MVARSSNFHGNSTKKPIAYDANDKTRPDTDNLRKTLLTRE